MLTEHLTTSIDWCLRRSDWRVANVNLPNAPRTPEPVATKVSVQSYFADSFDVRGNMLTSEIGYQVDALAIDDDIYQFAIERRISATLITQIVAC